jgi:hypothetical protein
VVVDTSSWKCGHGAEGVSLLFPHPPHQNVRGGRAQLSDNPLHPIFIDWGKESGVVRRAQLRAEPPQPIVLGVGGRTAHGRSGGIIQRIALVG